jgi:hypothetical protein
MYLEVYNYKFCLLIRKFSGSAAEGLQPLGDGFDDWDVLFSMESRKEPQFNLGQVILTLFIQ